MSADGYERFYQQKLWQLLPAMYRADDSVSLDEPGPLREIVDRLAAQAAIVRRSIDRLWEDQGIESCDDWVIAYLGDLLATNLVASLDARGQRIDVAKTIYYRRRKGTLPLLEELAADVTGWDARAVEFFRRLARTRHLLDPAIVDPAAATDPEGAHTLAVTAGLIGARTGTGQGGLADLRDVYGASRATTAFDELSHTVDVRRGAGQVGWHDIPRLGFFLWRRLALPVEQVTPVMDATCPNQFSFDPSGREVPLHAASSRPLGDTWISPAEHQLPTAISTPLLAIALDALYAAPDPADPSSVMPRSLAIYRKGGLGFDLVAAAGVTGDPRDVSRPWLVEPERGRLLLRPALGLVAAADLRLSYCYGFSSTIGAGPYDRRVAGAPASAQPAPRAPTVTGGGNRFATAVAAIAARGTASIGDNLTYTGAGALAGIEDVRLAADNRRRPLLRFPAAAGAWTLTGAGDASRLVLEGLWIAGADLAIAGTFDEVRLTCVTLDPGTRATTGSGFARAVDGRELTPTVLRISGHVRRLVIERSICGPIAVVGGRVETLSITDSIVQAADGGLALDVDDGDVELSRVTLLGRADLHRLEASESILRGRVTVDDRQHGCVRFSAWTRGSELPRQYESVEVATRDALFTSQAFGDPGYAQLRDGVDDVIAPIAGDPRPRTIAAGAADGSEMGAFARDRNPIKERSLLIKLHEYMPLGLEPVLVHVT